ncbi:hypothetical protein BED47_20605 [Gottfriedia luciferensis]|uniref:NADH dehydrogenase subunit 1 n=1 Tax=Gottfriedia luciferensis TaxID=178774 RepID=A0ABX2ZRJ0_9BACI|nr:hypothetical protein BED47_20605 [Gottfriedia luciferensis]SFC17985.1 hypothetical protein SAMN02799633_00002 [Bacillus sp. UNCCL81]
MKVDIGFFLFCLFFIVSGITLIIMGLRYTKEKRENDKNSRYVIAGNGWFDEFLRTVLPLMPVWVTKIVYIILGLFLLILGIDMLF